MTESDECERDTPASNVQADQQTNGAPDRHWRIELRQVLTNFFNAEELKTLCFDLDVEYDALPGEGQADKARELVAYLDRHRRIPDLLSTLSRQRPDLARELESKAIPDMAHGTESSHSIDQGLNALLVLMKTPEVRDAVIESSAVFEEASEQIDVVGDYKKLHDKLHTLQFICYKPIVEAEKSFPDDKKTINDLKEYKRDLREIVGNLKEIALRPTLAAMDTLWIQELDKVCEALNGALQKLDVAQLRDAIWLLGRVIAQQPSYINKRLNQATADLDLSKLVRAMAHVHKHLLVHLAKLDAETVNQFQTAIDDLDALNQRLDILVRDHDRWQRLDDELRRMDASLDQCPTKLRRDWEYIRGIARTLCCDSTDERVKSFCEESEILDDAIAAGNKALIEQCFKAYWRQAGRCFLHVDEQLLGQCDELRKVRDPLALVIGATK